MHVADPRRLRSTDGAETPDLVAPGRLEARRGAISARTVPSKPR
jgi:hypothetical protein